jgi:uncharacterized protein
MSIISPFKFGRIVTGDSFINREDEKNRIRNNILSRNNTIIISPRRWGKSSLLRQVASEMESDKIRFVFLDIYKIRTEEDFFTSYSREVIKATITRKEEVLNMTKKFFQRIMPVISFKVDPLHDLSLKFNWEEAKEAIDEIIDLPEKVAKDKGLQIIVCIDEFQNIARIKDYEKLEETLRSYWQLQEQVSYCLYGSRKHMMVDIFNRESRPFYRFGDIMMLGKIPEEHWIDFIVTGFKDTGKSISLDLARVLISTAGNHPEYVQQLAHHTWSLTEKQADELILSNAVELVMDTNSIFYQEICDDLSNTQINLIKAVFQGETQFTSAEVMQKYNLGTPRNVSKNKETLEAKDIIDFSSDPAQFTDPFFIIWFQKIFLG